MLKELKMIFQISLKDLFHDFVQLLARILLEFDMDLKGNFVKISTTSLQHELDSFEILK